MKYKKWLEIWLDNYVKTTCKARTSNIYRYRIGRCIVPHLGEYDLRELTLPILQQFVTDLLNPSEGKALSANTVNGVISVAQNSLKTAFTLGYIDVYEANKIRRPRTVEKKVECFSLLEQKQIETQLTKGNKLKLYGIVICMYTGLRLGELLALEWKNVDLNACQLTVEKTCYYVDGQRIEDAPKTVNSLRSIPFPKQLLEMFALSMDNKIPQYSGEPCFKTRKGDMQSPQRGSISPFLVGESKGGNAPFGTRLCLQSVVCYTLCRRCRKNAVAAGVGKDI